MTTVTFAVVVRSCFGEVSYQASKPLKFSVHHTCETSCTFHTSHNSLVTSNALTSFKLTTSRVVSSDETEHLPVPHFQIPITPTGVLVTATGRVNWSHSKVEAYFEHFGLFSESSECGGVCRRYYIMFLV